MVLHRDVRRVARTMREAFPDPKDWFEGPFGQRHRIEWTVAWCAVALLLTLAYVAWAWWSL